MEPAKSPALGGGGGSATTRVGGGSATSGTTVRPPVQDTPRDGAHVTGVTAQSVQPPCDLTVDTGEHRLVRHDEALGLTQRLGGAGVQA